MEEKETKPKTQQADSSPWRGFSVPSPGEVRGRVATGGTLEAHLLARRYLPPLLRGYLLGPVCTTRRDRSI